MKKTIQKIGFVAFTALTLTSCSVTAPVTASGATIGAKRGVSETNVVLGIELNKDFGIKEAAKNGNITTPIATVDQTVFTFLGGLFMKKELIITAE